MRRGIKSRLLRTLLVILVMAAVVFAGGYLLFGGGRSYSSDPGALRAQFNQDGGKVRLLMVLSPT